MTDIQEHEVSVSKNEIKSPLPSTSSGRRLSYFSLILVSIFFALGWYIFSTPFRTEDHIIIVTNGSTLRNVATLLQGEHIIRVPEVFMAFVQWNGKGKSIPAGSYFVSQKSSIFTIAEQFGEGDFQIPIVRVTIPEGVNTAKIGSILHTALTNFDEAEFNTKASREEGYLFPNTYNFFANATPDDVIQKMKSEFLEQIVPLQENIKESGHSLDEVIIMASLIEGEVATTKDRHLVSGILWKRIAIGMPLQVDATFNYLLGKGSSELSLNDLKHESPFNTYRNRGLPPAPIGNPGIDAITAVLEPVASPYLFYLSDKNGVIHYAKDFEEHKENKRRYLP